MKIRCEIVEGGVLVLVPVRLDQPVRGQVDGVLLPALQVQARLHPRHILLAEDSLLGHVAKGLQAGGAETAVRREVALGHDNLAE